MTQRELILELEMLKKLRRPGWDMKAMYLYVKMKHGSVAQFIDDMIHELGAYPDHKVGEEK